VVLQTFDFTQQGKTMTQKLNPNANVTITFDGLMLMAFNHDPDDVNKINQTEFGILRGGGKKMHRFKINVETKYGDSTISSSLIEMETNVRIYVEGNPASVEKYENGSFSRKNPDQNDPHDLRWGVDLEQDGNGNPIALANKAGFPAQTLIVKQGVFYTYGTKEAILRLPNENDKFPARVGSPLGCQIELTTSEKLKIDVYDENNQTIAESHTFSLSGNKTLFIEITNYDEKSSEGLDGDFHLYYEQALQDTSITNHYELFQVPPRVNEANRIRLCGTGLLASRTTGINYPTESF
jgi:hypothetical protein